MTAIRVLLVDDQALVRGGLRRILEGQADLLVIGEAGDGLEKPPPGPSRNGGFTFRSWSRHSDLSRHSD